MFQKQIFECFTHRANSVLRLQATRCQSTSKCSSQNLSAVDATPSSGVLTMEKDYSRFLNFTSRNRESSIIRGMTDLQSKMGKEGAISFGGGFPNPGFFPFKDAVLTLKTGEKIHLDAEMMEEAQQYGPTSGSPHFLEWSKTLVQHYHSPPAWDQSRVAITAGSQDGFSRCLEMLLAPGDHVVVEEPSFCGALNVMNPYKVRFLPVETDSQGMIPESLLKLLSKWSPEEVKNATENIPKIMYTNPSASNPSGVSLTTERKRVIYEIAREYNLLILEDDPYYFLQFADVKDFPKSFLSLDTDGRVIRFDSFSKIMASGFRVGCATGPSQLITKMVQHSEVTILHTASISQVILNELLNLWSIDGLEKHMSKVRAFYLSQRNTLLRAAGNHLSGLCEWNVPSGGMFLWIKVLAVDDTREMVMQRAIGKKLLMMPGSTFMTNQSQPCPYIRLSYSFISPDDMEEGCRRLAEIIQEEIDRNATRCGKASRSANP